MRGRVGEPPYLKYSELHKTKSHVLKRDLVRTNIKKYYKRTSSRLARTNESARRITTFPYCQQESAAKKRSTSF